MAKRQYDARDLLACIIDADSLDEYKADYGKTLVTAYARIGGRSVGIVANQRHQVRTKKAGIQMGGVIYPDSADKAARFVMDCNQTGLPIIFFQDVTGFMVGRDAEQSGIIRSGAKLVNAVSNSIVPKITVIVGGSFGAGNYALCGKAYDPRFILAWPNARYAVMGAAQASDTVFSVLKRSRERGDQQSNTGGTRAIAREGEGNLRRADRHPLRRRARLGRRHHPAARHARRSRAIVRLRQPTDAAGRALSHGCGADLARRSRKTEGEGQRTENGDQTSEIRGQASHVGRPYWPPSPVPNFESGKQELRKRINPGGKRAVASSLQGNVGRPRRRPSHRGRGQRSDSP